METKFASSDAMAKPCLTKVNDDYSRSSFGGDVEEVAAAKHLGPRNAMTRTVLLKRGAAVNVMHPNGQVVDRVVDIIERGHSEMALGVSSDDIAGPDALINDVKRPHTQTSALLRESIRC